MAESIDGDALLFGEAKWVNKTNLPRIMNTLEKQAENFPKLGNRKIVLAAWCKQSQLHSSEKPVFTASDVLAALKK